MFGYKVGQGPIKVSLIAGCHSDEPVGPHTLRQLLLTFAKEPDHPWLKRATFFIQPHMNPDGEDINRTWMDEWPDPLAFVQHQFRESPGRDLEFGFPDLRPENIAWTEWLKRQAPVDLHLSLHGMGFSEGFLLLIERHWISRLDQLKSNFRTLAQQHGFALHDHDRKGDKGFLYFGPGFSSTPEGKAMQAHFERAGDSDMASRFKLSSMEWVRSLGGDPLCLVSELPLFCIHGKAEAPQAGIPLQHLAFKQALGEVSNNNDLEVLMSKYDVRPVPIQLTCEVQLALMEWGILAREHN